MWDALPIPMALTAAACGAMMVAVVLMVMARRAGKAEWQMAAWEARWAATVFMAGGLLALGILRGSDGLTILAGRMMCVAIPILVPAIKVRPDSSQPTTSTPWGAVWPGAMEEMLALAALAVTLSLWLAVPPDGPVDEIEIIGSALGEGIFVWDALALLGAGLATRSVGQVLARGTAGLRLEREEGISWCAAGPIGVSYAVWTISLAGLAAWSLWQSGKLGAGDIAGLQNVAGLAAAWLIWRATCMIWPHLRPTGRKGALLGFVLATAIWSVFAI